MTYYRGSNLKMIGFVSVLCSNARYGPLQIRVMPSNQRSPLAFQAENSLIVRDGKPTRRSPGVSFWWVSNLQRIQTDLGPSDPLRQSRWKGHNIAASGCRENASTLVPINIRMVQSRSRVSASRIWVVESMVIAISQLHGDQAMVSMWERRFALAMHQSQESGTPRTTLAEGWESRPSSFRMVEVLGANGSAEGRMCMEDWAVTSKNPVTKRKRSSTGVKASGESVCPG